MPLPERPGGEPHKEQEPSPYYRAARFREEPISRRTYFQLQDTIFATNNELSAYRFQLDQIWHVAVVGDQPP